MTIALISDLTMMFHPANFLYWVLLGIGVVFFGLIIFVGGGDEDVEIEAETEIDGGDSGFAPWQMLSWFGLGKAPVMLLLAIDFSTWGMTGWILNSIFATLTDRMPTRLLGWGGLIFLASFAFSLFTGSLLSRPIGQLFVTFSEDVSSERLIGCVGTVTSKKIPLLTEGRIGQVDIYDMAGTLVTINACLPQWANVVPHHGQQVLIIDQQKHSYIAIAKDSSDEDKWLDRASFPPDS